jgi:hypothetical protein
MIIHKDGRFNQLEPRALARYLQLVSKVEGTNYWDFSLRNIKPGFLAAELNYK